MWLKFLCTKSIIVFFLVINSCHLWMDFYSFFPKHLPRAWNAVLERAAASLVVWLTAAFGKLGNSFRAGKDRHITKVYAPWCLLQPFSLMGGRSGRYRVCRAWPWSLCAWCVGVRKHAFFFHIFISIQDVILQVTKKKTTREKNKNKGHWQKNKWMNEWLRNYRERTI